MSFIDSFDMNLIGSLQLENIEKECALVKLNELKEIIHKEYVRLDCQSCREDYLSNIKSGENKEVSANTASSYDKELYEYKAKQCSLSKRAYEEIIALLSCKDNPCSSNSISVRKDLYIIDFLFIKQQPFETLQKVVSSFKMSTLEGIDVEKSNDRLNKRLNNIPY